MLRLACNNTRGEQPVQNSRGETHVRARADRVKQQPRDRHIVDYVINVYFLNV